MGLRDQNPFIEQDLALVIGTFERRMARSRDADSVFVGFRRDLEGYANVPASFIDSIDLLPSIQKELSEVSSDGQTRDDESEQSQGRRGRRGRHGRTFKIVSPEETTGEVIEEEEDVSPWEEEVASWGEECQPCDFRQMWEDAQGFGDDLLDLWDNVLDDILDQLPSLEDLLDQSDIDLADLLCEMFDLFKFQCNPDLEKIAWLLSQFLNQMELEISDLLSGIFDQLLTALMEPLFNAMMASLDLIEDLILGPVQCILDEIRRQIEQISRNKSAFENAFNYNPSTSSSAQAEADRLREEIQSADQAEQQSERSPQAALDGMNRTLDVLDQVASLEIFKTYVERAHTFMKEKKDWLVAQLSDILGQQEEEFNRRLDFATGKISILQLIALIRAIIELAKNGSISCGPDAEVATEEEYRLLIGTIVHPSESSDISVEDDMIVVRRRDPDPSRGPVITPGSGGIDSPGGVGSPGFMENVVIRRPVASCLKKVTQDQAEQTRMWISQLEQEG
jgi:hypothetical protein